MKKDKTPVLITPTFLVKESLIAKVVVNDNKITEVKLYTPGYSRTLHTSFSIEEVYENWKDAPEIDDLTIPLIIDATLMVRMGDIFSISCIGHWESGNCFVTYKDPCTSALVEVVACRPFNEFMRILGYTWYCVDEEV